MKKLIISLAILIPLLMTACKEAKKKAPVKPEYDFRDEQYQDFYSRFKRQREEDCKTNCLASYFDAKDIEKALNIKNVPNSVVGFVSISRIPEENNIIRDINHFKSKEDVLSYYSNKSLTNDWFMVKLCSEHQEVEKLFCLNSGMRTDYFYLPKNTTKLHYFDKSIDFSCIFSSYSIEKYDCSLSNYPDTPYNLNIKIEFTDPNNFFYIIPYVEKLIFNSTGEHVWQTSS